MKTIKYLDRVKKKLDISSNYGLAKAMELERQMVNAYYRGERVPDAYACTKIAILLGEDPALVIAEIQAENEKNAKKKGFWRDFALRVGKLAVVIVAPIFMLSYEHESMAANGGKSVNQPDRTSHYTKSEEQFREKDRCLFHCQKFYQNAATRLSSTVLNCPCSPR